MGDADPFEAAYAALTRPSLSVASSGPVIATTAAAPITKPPPAHKKPKPNAIGVHPSQSSNPLLQQLPSHYLLGADALPDFALSDTCHALFLSIKFHKLNPSYIAKRMTPLRNKLKTQVLLVHVDDVDCEQALLHIQTLAFAFQFVVFLAWTLPEASNYLQSLAKYSVAGATALTLLEGRRADDLALKTAEILTTIPAVNKNDAKTLMRNFPSLAEIFNASMTDLSILSGFGDTKIKQMQAFNEPFFHNPPPS